MSLRKIVLAIALAALFTSPSQSAKDYYGPLTVSVSGKKEVVKARFNAPEGRTAWLQITNGANSSSRAKSLVVILNGHKIVTKKEINIKKRKGRFTILLRSVNDIKVVARGSGAEVSLKVKSRKAGFKRLAGFGDSLLAGFQDGSLVESCQVWGFGAQIAKQVGAEFILPLISEPGIPPRMVEMSDGTIKPKPNTGPGYRINPDQEVDNLAVPGANVWTSLNVAQMGISNPLYTVILGGQRTMIEEVKSRKPTFVILWVGSNDILGMALNTNPEDYTRLSDFKRDFETVLRELRSVGAGVVAANLPDVTALGVLVEPAPAALFNLPSGAVMPIIRMLEILATFSFSSITPDDYLDLQEQAQIRSTIVEFNNIIATLCEKYGVPIVDMFAFSRRIKNEGVYLGGQHLTTKFRGGLYSLDAIHPTNTCQALVANEFIEIINNSYNSNIPKVNLLEVLVQDPNRPTGAEPGGRPILSEEPSPYRPMLRILRSGKKFSSHPKN